MRTSDEPNEQACFGKKDRIKEFGTKKEIGNINYIVNEKKKKKKDQSLYIFLMKTRGDHFRAVLSNTVATSHVLHGALEMGLEQRSFHFFKFKNIST